jgi:hypothetical protein
MVMRCASWSAAAAATTSGGGASAPVRYCSYMLNVWALTSSGGIAKKVAREFSDHADQILHIPRRLVLRTGA